MRNTLLQNFGIIFETIPYWKIQINTNIHI